MTTSRIHEHFKDLLGLFVSEVATELKIPRSGGGETTWKRPELARGSRPTSATTSIPRSWRPAAAMKRRSKNIADYPNPDLAIEIDISPPEVDRPGIYAATPGSRSLAVRWGGGHHRATPGRRKLISKSKMSRFLPVKDIEIRRWILEEDTSDQSAWCRRLRTWARRLARRNPRPRRPRRRKGHRLTTSASHILPRLRISHERNPSPRYRAFLADLFLSESCGIFVQAMPDH